MPRGYEHSAERPRRESELPSSTYEGEDGDSDDDDAEKMMMAVVVVMQ